MLKIAVPHIEEQKEITNYLDLIEAKVNFLDKKKQNLQNLFQTLLHQMMTAKIQVSELNLDSLNLDLEEKD